MDPDVILTSAGDSYLFPYLIQRASVNNVLDEFVLGRDKVPFKAKATGGRKYFYYGRTFYRASIVRLHGRIHIDENNTFIIGEADFEGYIEIARTCRVPLHTAARFSIGSSMSSIQFYQALKDDILLPRNKKIPEAFKSALDRWLATAEDSSMNRAWACMMQWQNWIFLQGTLRSCANTTFQRKLCCANAAPTHPTESQT